MSDGKPTSKGAFNMKISSRQIFRPATSGDPPAYAESSVDFVRRNIWPAARLLDAASVPSPQGVRLLQAQADRMLNEYVEAEMFRIMREHPSCYVILKCMGALTAYRRRFGKVHAHNFAFLQPLQNLLAECDGRYYVRTERPLKITRGTPDATALHHSRNW
jgi:hypothetical protein